MLGITICIFVLNLLDDTSFDTTSLNHNNRGFDACIEEESECHGWNNPRSVMVILHDEGAVGTSEEELSCGEVDAPESQEYSSGAGTSGEQDLKGMLLRKYSGYLSSLRKEFLKKRKKGKLPKDARTTLMDWWNTHYRWPYPTEEEKLKLSEATGLDQKQINNWFINQRKRHWKPSEDMRSAALETGSASEPMYLDTEGGTGGDDI